MSFLKSEAPEMPLVACVSAMEGVISVAIVQAIRSEPAIDTLMELGVTAPTDAGHPTREGDADDQPPPPLYDVDADPLGVNAWMSDTATSGDFTMFADIDDDAIFSRPPPARVGAMFLDEEDCLFPAFGDFSELDVW